MNVTNLPSCCPSPATLWPTFLVIGERKCGTSSFFSYMLDHPHMLPPRTKEPGFFSLPSLTGKSLLADCCEYGDQFPATRKMDRSKPICMEQLELMETGRVQKVKPFCRVPQPGHRYMTGEASATTLTTAHPHVVQRVLPSAKLIVLMRCPVARLLSHYEMYARFQAEGRADYRTLSPLTALVQTELIGLQSAKCSPVTQRRLFSRRKPCYLGHLVSPGLYLSWLLHWAVRWKRNALLPLFTEDLNAASSSAASLATYMKRPLLHVGLDPDAFPTASRRGDPYRSNVAARVAVGNHVVRGGEGKSATLRRLENLTCPVYAPANAALAKWLGRELPVGWRCRTGVA